MPDATFQGFVASIAPTISVMACGGRSGRLTAGSAPRARPENATAWCPPPFWWLFEWPMARIQAVALKKYRCGTSPVSWTSDNEHTAASLGHCEIPSVQHSVGEPLSVDVREPEAFAD